MPTALILALIHGGLHSAVGLILFLAGLACLGGAVWRAVLRDLVGTIALAIIGIVLLYLAA